MQQPWNEGESELMFNQRRKRYGSAEGILHVIYAREQRGGDERVCIAEIKEIRVCRIS